MKVLEKMFTHFDFPIFFQLSGLKPPSSCDFFMFPLLFVHLTLQEEMWSKPAIRDLEVRIFLGRLEECLEDFHGEVSSVSGSSQAAFFSQNGQIFYT